MRATALRKPVGILDAFMGGVLCTLSALVIGISPFMAKVRAGAEVATSPRLAFMLDIKDEERNNCYSEKRPAGHRQDADDSASRDG
jgi:hypothetical protein